MTSEIASAFADVPGVGLSMTARDRWTKAPLAGCPLTATMSAKAVATKKFFGGEDGVMFELVAYFDESVMSP